MPIKKRVGKRRSGTAEPTEQEWAWLTAARGCSAHLGHFPVNEVREHGTPLRLAELWREHKDEILTLWREDPPARLPFAHPAELDLPPDLRSSSAPDPRYLLGEPSPAEVKAYEDARAAWLEARRAWFSGQ